MWATEGRFASAFKLWDLEYRGEEVVAHRLEELRPLVQPALVLATDFQAQARVPRHSCAST